MNHVEGSAGSLGLEVAAPGAPPGISTGNQRPEWLLSHTLLEKLQKPLGNQSVRWCSATQDNQVGEKWTLFKTRSQEQNLFSGICRKIPEVVWLFLSTQRV